jgi:hypothetical protein
VETRAGAAVARGRALEREVAALFAGHGYRVETNVVREGRSGARHEIDVLAERPDALTRSRVLVECKARAEPIEKDVVATAHLVMLDLGLNHGVVVSLGGWTSGAEAAARERGLELWGPEELRRHLGDLRLLGLGGPPAGRPAVGVPAAVSGQRAEASLARRVRGVVRPERLVALGLLWMPWHQLRIATSRDEGALRPRVVTRRAWNRYDGLRGGLVRSSAAEPALERVDTASGALPTRIGARRIEADLARALAGWRDAATDAGAERHAERLAALGIEVPLHDLVVESAALVHLPAWTGLLARRGAERVVALDAVTGRVDEDLGRLLTAEAALVREALAAEV